MVRVAYDVDVQVDLGLGLKMRRPVGKVAPPGRLLLGAPELAQPSPLCRFTPEHVSMTSKIEQPETDAFQAEIEGRTNPMQKQLRCIGGFPTRRKDEGRCKPGGAWEGRRARPNDSYLWHAAVSHATA